jgi:hypothetical protein
VDRPAAAPATSSSAREDVEKMPDTASVQPVVAESIPCFRNCRYE